MKIMQWKISQHSLLDITFERTTVNFEMGKHFVSKLEEYYSARAFNQFDDIHCVNIG